MNEGFILSLIEKFNASSIVSLELKQGDDTLSLRKKEACECMVPPPPPFRPDAHPPVGMPPAPQPLPAVAPSAASPVGASAQSAPASAAATAAPQAADDAGLVPVKSPIVGTFYRAPSPDAPVYVEEGKAVKKGEPLCILEAMKMMNTLESEFDCTVEKILVQNGDLVEFDQPLFLVRKS